MTKRKSHEFKVSKPATSGLEKAITECISEMKRRKVVVKRVKMVVKSLVSESYKEHEIKDGIKDMANMGKLRLGGNKSFVKRTINLSANETEIEADDTSDKALDKVNERTEMMLKDDKKDATKDETKEDILLSEIMDNTKDEAKDDKME